MTATVINMLIPFTMSNIFYHQIQHCRAGGIISCYAATSYSLFACSQTVNLTLCKRMGFYTSKGTGPCLDLALKVSISFISNFTITVNQPTPDGFTVTTMPCQTQVTSFLKNTGIRRIAVDKTERHYKKLEKWKLWTLLTSTNA